MSSLIGAEPVPLEIGCPGFAIAAVYRLWAANGRCLYVGQTCRQHPILRVVNHVGKPWWRDIARADYVPIKNPDKLDQAEAQMIHRLMPVHNVHRPLSCPRCPGARGLRGVGADGEPEFIQCLPDEEQVELEAAARHLYHMRAAAEEISEPDGYICAKYGA